MNKIFTCGVGVFVVLVQALSAQTTYDWLGTAPDGNWSQGAAGARWSGGFWDVPPATGVLRFNNNHQLTMINNASGYNVNELFFDAGNTSARTIGGNDLQFFDFSGNDPEIINNSTAGHIINLNIIGDNNNTFQIGANSGDLTFGGTFNNNGSAIRVYSTGAHNVNFNGVISGGGGLTLDGNTIVHLNNAHTYSGNTTVNAGTLMFETGGTAANSTMLLGGNSGETSDASLLGNGGTYGNNITVRSGNSGTMTIGQTGGGNAVFNGSITMQKGLTLTATTADRSADFTGVFSGNQALTIDAAGGKVILSGSGNNDFSSVTISAGFVDLNKTAGINAIDSDITMNGGSLTLKDNNQIADSATVTMNSGTFAIDGNTEQIGRLNTEVGTSVTLGRGLFTLTGSSDSTINGALTGSARYFDEDEGTTILGGRIRNLGTGKITVNGSNTGMLGDWYAYNGTISYNHNNAAGSGIIFLGNTSGSDDAKIDIGTSGVNLANNITVRSTGGTKTIDNATAGGSRAVTFSGTITLTGSVNVDSSTGETITLGGVVSGAGGMVKRGFGETIMTRVNTFTGGMYIDEGKLTIGSGGDLTAVSTIDIGSTLHNGGAGNAEFSLASGAGAIDRNISVKAGAGDRTISSANNNTISGNIALDKAVTVNSAAGTLTLSGGINLSASGNNTMTVQGNGNVTMSGAISAASGAAKISKTGSGSLTISGNNSSEYMLNISAGSVNLNHNNALGSAYSDKVNFLGTSTLNVNADVGPSGLGLRAADGAMATLNVAGGKTFSVATLASIGTAGAFNKTGAGTMALNGNSSAFVGDLTLSDGRLEGIATVGGNFIQTGGVFAPGNSPGTFSILGDATWTGGTYLWEINQLAEDGGVAGALDGWDLVDVEGLLTIGAGYTLQVDDLASLTSWNQEGTYAWVIATAGAIAGDVSAMNLNVTGFDVNPDTPSYFYLSQTLTEVILNYKPGGSGDPDPPDPGPSAVPEPNTLSFVMLAGLVLFSLRAHIHRANRNPAPTPAVG
jgi:autotransporter-associated beta strand protein